MQTFRTPNGVNQGLVWGLMVVATLGFMQKPDGFFDCNPALDLPPVTA